MARKNKNKNKNGDGMELAAAAVTPPATPPVVEHDAGDESDAAPATPAAAPVAAPSPTACDTCDVVSHIDAAIAEAERSISAGDPRFAISRGLRMLREARKSFSRAT